MQQNLDHIDARKIHWTAIHRSQASLLLRGKPLPSAGCAYELDDGRLVARDHCGNFHVGTVPKESA